jgi:hypothetical protein
MSSTAASLVGVVGCPIVRTLASAAPPPPPPPSSRPRRGAQPRDMAVDVAVRGDGAIPGLQMQHKRRTILGATVVPLLMSRAPPAQVTIFLPANHSDDAAPANVVAAPSQALSSAANTAWEALGGGPADLYYPDEFVGAWYARPRRALGPEAIVMSTRATCGVQYVPRVS